MPALTWKGLRLCKHSGEMTQGSWTRATLSRREDSLFTCCMRLRSSDVSLEEDTSGYGSNEVYLSLCVRGRHCTYKRDPWKNPTISSQKHKYQLLGDVTENVRMSLKVFILLENVSISCSCDLNDDHDAYGKKWFSYLLLKPDITCVKKVSKRFCFAY